MNTKQHRLFAIALFFIGLCGSVAHAQFTTQTFIYKGPRVFAFTGGVQTYTVPAGITSVTVDMAGGAGGFSYGGGGSGGRVQATLAVTPGDILNVYVGGQFNLFNGAGLGGSAYGGGGTDIRVGGTALSNRVLVAGGGGSGSGTNNSAGGAGGQTGSSGAGETTTNAGGGTASGGGSGGVSGSNAGTAGTSGQGGTGNYSGGGGGYYGGGGGADGSGGGGSSYAGTGTSSVTYTTGYNNAKGYVVIAPVAPLYQTFTVPTGVSSLNIDMAGAQGGTGNANHIGGSGGRVQATLAVTAGATLYLYVGAAGYTGGVPANTNGAGYYGGGGCSSFGGSGGDGTDIRTGGIALANRVLVAGGGGAGSSSNMGGAGGGTTGGAVTTGNIDNPFATGGTPTAGGAAGIHSGNSGTAGTLGIGGTGYNGGGNGGGGGYYGGGGGGFDCGGGGSSYAGTGTSGVTHTQGYQAGNGYITISYTTPVTYYSNATGSLDATGTWGSNTDGTGTHPTDFTGAAATYTIANGNTAGMAGDWTISGIGSALKLSGAMPMNGHTLTTPDITNGIPYGNYLRGSKTSNLVYTAAPTGPITMDQSTVNGDYLATLTLNGNATMATYAGLEIATTLALNGSILTTLNANLYLYGTVTRTTGGIDASAPTGSGIFFLGSTAQTMPANMFTGIVQNLYVNGAGVTLGSRTTVASTLGLQAGSIAVTGGLILSPGALVNIFNGSLAAPFSSTGAVDVTTNRDKTAGNELTPSTGSIHTLKIQDGTYTLSAPLTLTGNLTIISYGTLNTGTYSLSFSNTGSIADIAGKFMHANTTGFSGGIGTAISNVNSPTITLEPYSQMIYNGTAAQVVDARTDYQYLTINSGATLAGNTTVAGMLTLAAPLTVGNNTLTIGGFSGNATNGLKVTSGSTVTTTGTGNNSLYFVSGNNTLGTLNANGSITIGNTLNIAPTGTANIGAAGALNANGNLVLTSDGTGTARIPALATGGTITGNVQVQRYIPGQRGYRLLGHPYTTTQSLTQMSSSFDITGVAGAYSTCGGTNPSVFSYIPGSSPAYVGIATATNSFPNATAGNTHPNGILAFVRGAPGEDCLTTGTTTPSNITFTTTGAVNTGTITETVPAGGWNLVSNPYPSQVDLSLVTGVSSLDARKIINPAQQNGSHTYTNGTTYIDLGATAILPINGAFLAHNGTGSDITITFTEASKTSSTPVTNTFKTTSMYSTLGLEVYNGGNLWDNWGMQMRPQAGNNAGDNGDLGKMSNAQFDIYSLSADNKQMNLDVRDADSIADGAIIALGIRSVPQATYTLAVSDNSLPANKIVYLHDRYTNAYTELNNGANYTFTVDANAASRGEGRLELLFNNITIGVNKVAGIQNKMQIAPNPAVNNITLSYPAVFAGAKEVSIVNTIGQVVRSVNTADKIVTMDVNGLAAGIYLVKTVTGDNVAIGRFIKN